ncbi:flagellin-like protein [Halarchaeum solikamskense]|uniref:archaellin/type IV pilin N-terminal domain-containing protein n=1 Tax=Halarchaeum nitratireducens TaxID=489913 RepID=UPI001B3B1785|nr:archaellin/type IV pilin N-terminal domain-containing protein [Halarchaeum solikamskense]MBP2252413.1 flagellin-like protein [Halarchaeum solikamskense]
MFDDILPERTDRGQVGIGTLIIFIALVLVAAVAAGVLVTTADQLQTRASDTGTDAQAQVSNQIDVVSATGEDTNDDDALDTVTLVAKKSPGSEAIDLSEATIQYTSANTSETLSYGSSGADDTTFTTNQVGGGPTTVLSNTSERVEIEISTSALETNGLDEGSSASLDIVDQSGATTTYGVNVPDVLTGSYVKV